MSVLTLHHSVENITFLMDEIKNSEGKYKMALRSLKLYQSWKPELQVPGVLQEKQNEVKELKNTTQTLLNLFKNQEQQLQDRLRLATSEVETYKKKIDELEASDILDKENRIYPNRIFYRLAKMNVNKYQGLINEVEKSRDIVDFSI